MRRAPGRGSRCAPRFALALLLLLACARRTPEQRAWEQELRAERAQKDAFMRDGSSPLTPEQRASFHGLRYFDPDAAFVHDTPLEATAAPDTVRFATSKNTVEAYVRHGVLRFEHRGRSCALTVFRAPDGTLFLPFADATSGHETYGAGRYLEPQLLPDGRYRLDFNRAYNPYCAYNANWVCPIPPAENRLELRVEAGEKVFHAP